MEQRTLVRISDVNRCQCGTRIRSVKLKFGCQRYLGICTDGVLKSLERDDLFFITVKGSRIEDLEPRASVVLDPRVIKTRTAIGHSVMEMGISIINIKLGLH